MLRLSFTVFFILCIVNISFSQNSLRDSLLTIYTEHELKEMSSRELGNAIRKMRGQEPIPPSPTIQWSDEDKYGFKIIRNINSDSLESEINKSVSDIVLKADKYEIKIFPNSYVDIINRFEYGFYSNLKTRELRHKNYHNLDYSYEGDETFRLNTFTNNSRRTYFLDENDSIQKIIIETGKNVNPGKEYDWPFSIQYQKTTFYVKGGNLLYVKQLFFGEDFNGDPATLEESDSLSRAEVKNYYFFKNNCISSYSAKSYHKNIESIGNNLLHKSEYCNNELAAQFKNYIKEYFEYTKGENDYLKPHEGSYTQPETIFLDEK
ncbi:hypothetical protein C9994_07550 [Marivirga lumbricoides]|uniref:Uncharacterized protein n=1 Tax=Marivirga lumbricoides TaxID=1046115 RepID=A0A2T4DRH5_9BACT|nr:hypothetical protein C9994_07550 [Marivirga lumbricoides]